MRGRYSVGVCGTCGILMERVERVDVVRFFCPSCGRVDVEWKN
jgi:predicted RNA-binding Zn-ribbon protein involved in translation (DUF1610 family)